MSKNSQIYKDICEAAGIVDSRLNGALVFFDVKEMREKDGSSVYRTRPSGRFQINVSVPGENRDRIFRTKVKDGSFDMPGVIGALHEASRIRKAEVDREAARTANTAIAETIRNKYKITKTYVSSYASSVNSFCAPSSAQGKVAIQLYFGAVDPAVAEKIMAFAQSLEA